MHTKPEVAVHVQLQRTGLHVRGRYEAGVRQAYEA
jgi:hypothetical protein